MHKGLTRREVLQGGVGAGAALGASALLSNPLLKRALAAPPRCGSLRDIDHVVILIQENRSFDHYFGSYRGVVGYSDPNVLPLNDGSGLTIFAQPGYTVLGYNGHLYPFHIDTTNNGECTNDINHGWGPQHIYWDSGRLDKFVSEHIAVDGLANGPLTMGYYRRPDLAFYYALADAFTICDHYHCSVIGPTDPNRLYSMSASLGADGSQGGPILTTSTTRLERFGTLSWTTMPERLQAAGISWRVYGTADGHYGDNVLPYFKNYLSNPVLTANALNPLFPADFIADVAAGRLPQVSWVLASLVESEHPPAPVEWGQYATAQVLQALISNPAIWNTTALFVTHDENGGFFDHVPPPTAPAGTAGEYLTVSPLPPSAAGTAGPIGLGFRVPLLIASPFARGGLVCSDTFDHTSTLRFLETRFGVEVPNLSAWRRSVTGDLTSAFNFVKVDASVPSLPQPSLTDGRVILSDCPTNGPISLADENAPIVATYPIPPNSTPTQETGTAPPPSGPVACQT